jgi:hypothetical protein
MSQNVTYFAIEKRGVTGLSQRQNDESRRGTAPRTLVYGCSKNTSNRATFGHFSARLAGLSGGEADSASSCTIVGSDLRWCRAGRSRDPVA